MSIAPLGREPATNSHRAHEVVNVVGANSSEERTSSIAPPLFGVAGLSALDVFAALAGCFLVVVFAPGLLLESWTPRAAVLGATLPTGLVCLTAMVVRRDRAALAAAGFLCWALVVGLTSENQRVAVVGVVARDASWLFHAACFGLWAIGRRMTDVGRRLLGIALVGGTTVQSMVAVAQVALWVEGGAVALVGERAVGLTHNPVPFGTLVAASAVLLACAMFDAGPRPFTVGLLGLHSMAIALSGNRSALVALVAGLAFARWRGQPRRGVVVLLTIVTGLVVGSVAMRWRAPGASALERSLGGPSGGRLTMWRLGVESALDRPLTGYGIGRFRSAIQGNVDAGSARVVVGAFTDPHSLLVAELVWTGLIGLSMLLAFVALQRRLIGGPLLAFSAAIGVTLLLQGTTVYTLPVALLALGASARRDEILSGRRLRRAVAIPALLSGALLAGWLTSADANLRAARRSGDVDRVIDAAKWFPGDPVAGRVVMEFLESFATERPELWSRARDQAEVMTRAEVDNSIWWEERAEMAIAFQRYDDARLALAEARELQRWSPTEARLRWHLAGLVGDRELERSAVDDLCRMSVWHGKACSSGTEEG